MAIDTQAYVGGTSVYTFTETGANVVDNATYSVEVKYNMDETEKTATDSVKYEFVLPLFYGTSATKEIKDEMKNMKRQIRDIMDDIKEIKRKD